ncbi:MAG: GTP cyclohydrolase I FolE [bacterium]
MDLEKIEKGVRLILEALGISEQAGVLKTPERVAQLYAEIFSGIEADPSTILTPIEGESFDEMVLIRDIPFYSVCEHHLLPFMGQAHIAYIPANGKIVGISKLARVLEVLAKRPQVQERLTHDVVDLIMDSIKPKGAMVIIKAEHLCMSMRGIKKPNSKIITSAVRGIFRTNKSTREEMLELIK